MEIKPYQMLANAAASVWTTFLSKRGLVLNVRISGYFIKLKTVSYVHLREFLNNKYH